MPSGTVTNTALARDQRRIEQQHGCRDSEPERHLAADSRNQATMPKAAISAACICASFKTTICQPSSSGETAIAAAATLPCRRSARTSAATISKNRARRAPTCSTNIGAVPRRQRMQQLPQPHHDRRMPVGRPRRSAPDRIARPCRTSGCPGQKTRPQTSATSSAARAAGYPTLGGRGSDVDHAPDRRRARSRASFR